MRLARAFVLTLAASIGLGSLALAQPKSTATKPAPSNDAGAPVTRSPRASAIAEIAAEIARVLGPAPPGAVVAVSPLVTDVAAPKADELAMRVAAQIGGRLGAARVHPQPATLAAVRGAAGRGGTLVHVQLEIARGELRATADLYPVVANGWERMKQPAPGPRAHAFVAAPLDAEIRTFLAPIVLEQASVHKAKHDETDVLAVGCGDVDADGGHELVLATRSRVVLGKLRGGKLAVVRAAPWSSLSPRLPVPLREPIGSIVLRRGEILVGTTDRVAVGIDSALVARRQLTGLPLTGSAGDVCTSALPELGAFDGTTVACEGDAGAGLAIPSPRFDAAASLDLVGEDGSVAQVVAAREPGGKLRIRRTDASKSTELVVDGVGAQIALADLDLDGTPEVAFSGATDPDGDALVVSSWRPAGLTPRLRLATKEGVRAIAACPPEERGVPALVAVVGSEIWLVR